MNKYHFIGIGGIGMSALAHLLLDQKHVVSGSDLSHNSQVEALKKKGAAISLGHQAQQVTVENTVVYSSAVKPSNPEYQQALSLKCRLIHRSELLCELMKGYTNIAISGSHGKTTTSSLASHVFMQAGLDPSYALGGLLNGCNGRVGKGKHFIFEADESDGTFESYVPHYAIVTNLDHEHLDHYGTLEELKQVCDRFCQKVLDTLFYCKDDPHLILKGISYGFHEASDVRILKAEQVGFKQQMVLRDREGREHTLELPLIGRHNAQNAAAIFALAQHLGIEPEVIAEGLRTFPGVGRRMQVHADQGSILRLDDYAHHPTEVKTTIAGLKQAIQERRLVALFQPHRFSRTKEHLKTFATAFDQVDLLFVTDIYSAGESPIEGVTAQRLIESIRAHSTVPCHYLAREHWLDLNEILRPHDVFITMGAGDVVNIHPRLNPQKKMRIGVISGGQSCEHEISLRSAAFVSSVLDKQLYDVEPFFIDKEGKWSAQPGEKGTSFLHPSVAERLQACDMLFPVLHGTFGEDGTIQGLCEMLGKPYVGSDWASCALSMNKMHSKVMAASVGVNTPKAILFSHREWLREQAEWLAKAAALKFPLFVKPNNLGSSVGISKIHTPDELIAAIERVFKVDVEVLIEEGVIQAREVEFAVMGNHNGFQITVPRPGEKLAGGEFVNYDLKYSSSPVPTTIEPQFAPGVLERGQEAAWKVYRAIGCNGMTRVDFLLDAHHEWWFFELNSIPGMTSLSLFPKIWKREGVEPTQLMDRLIILALDRFTARKRYFNPCLV